MAEARLIPVDEEEKREVRLVPVETPRMERPPSPTIGERTIRGFMDVGQGLKQLYLMATDPEEAAKYTQQVNKDLAMYEAAIGTAQPPSIYGERGMRTDAGPAADIPRMVGNVMATAPAMLIPGGRELTLGGITARALQGAVPAAAMYSEAGTPESKLAQAATGAVAGVVAPEVVKGASRLALGAKDLTAAATRQATVMSPSQVRVEINNYIKTLDPQADISQLTATAQARLAEGAKQQLQVTGKLDPASLIRREDFEKLGMPYTSGQVTRDPRQFAAERNLAAIEGAGQPLLDIFTQQPRLLRERLEALRGQAQPTPLATGEAVTGAIGQRVDRSGLFGALGADIDAAYNAARSLPGAKDQIPFGDFRMRIQDTLDNFEDVIPSPVKKRIEQFAMGGDDGRAFSIEEAIKFRQLLTQRAGENPGSAKAMGDIKKQLDAYMAEVTQNIPEANQAVQKFREGIGLSAARAREFDPFKPIVAGQANQDQFFQRFIVGGQTKDVVALRDTLTKPRGANVDQATVDQARAAWDDVRAQTIQWLIDSAVGTSGAFSQAGFNSALKRIQPKLEVLFNKEEVDQLKRIGRASTAAFGEPATGGVPLINRSGTAPTLMNILTRSVGGNIPMVGPMMQNVSQRMQTAANVEAAQAAAQGGVVSPAVAAAREQQRRMLASRMAGPFQVGPFQVAPFPVAGGLLTEEYRR
jgi:hypothetical protein